MRRILAFDTSTEEVCLAIGTGRDDVPVVLDFPAPRAALGRLLPALTGLLDDNGVDIREIAAVVVGRGPGSFTGVRIGVATAKGLAHGLGAPLLGIGTLEAVARRFSTHEGLVGVVGDAMRREVYPLLCRCGGGEVEPLHDHVVSDPTAVAEEWAALDEPVLLTGNGLAKYRSVFEERMGAKALVAPPAEWVPSGAGLLAEAWARLEGPLTAALAGEASGRRGLGDPAVLLPIYTRLSDAEEAERRRAGVTPQTGVVGPETAP